MAKLRQSGQKCPCRGWRIDGGGAVMPTKAPWGFFLVLLALCQTTRATAPTCDPDAPATYTAAVVEYSPALGVTEENIAERFQDNINAYKNYINTAKKERADIVVFPECGLATLELPLLADGSPAVSVDVSNIGTNPCVEKDIFHSEEMRTLSCAARDAGIYVVVNLPEREHCSPALSFCPECPGFNPRQAPSGVVSCSINGFRFFNTDLAFDRKGTLIARYRKFNLFGEPGFVAPATAEHATFETDFGVRFGMFTCFDLMFEKPAVELVADLGVTDIIFPTAWFSELPFLTAVQTQSSWAWILDVNLLASGYNLPVVGSTGSGLYAGRRGAIAATMERSRASKMLVGQMPNARSCKASGLADHATLSGRTLVLEGPRGEVEAPAFARKLPPLPGGQSTMDCIRALPPRRVTIPSLYKCHLRSMLQMKDGRRLVRADTGEAPDDDSLQQQHAVPVKSEASSRDKDEELRLDEAEIGEVLAPQPDADTKLIYGHSYRKFIQDSMIRGMPRLQQKAERKKDPEDEYHFSGQNNLNFENDRSVKVQIAKDSDKKTKGNQNVKESKKDTKKEEKRDHIPTLEETAQTMMSNMKDVGAGSDQLTDVVEKVREDEEKAKWASRPQPSIDEMETILLGALREVSGNMTAEGDILDEVMLDVHETEQREAVEKKFVLERCQSILAEMAEDRTDYSDQEDDDEEGLPVIHDIEDNEAKQADNANPDEEEVEEHIEPALPINDFTDNDATDFSSDSNSNRENNKDEGFPAISIEESADVGELDEIAEEESGDTPIVGDASDSQAEMPSSEEEIIPEIPAEESDGELALQEPKESSQKPEPPVDSATQQSTPTPERKIKQPPKPEVQKDPIFDTEKPSEDYLYLKTEDLTKYSTLLLTSDKLIENSTLTVCHGVFCCHFTVALSVQDLRNLASDQAGEPVSFSEGDLGSYAFNRELYVHEREHDDFQSFAQLDQRFTSGRSYVLANQEMEGGDEEEDDDDDDDDDEIEMSEMEPEEYDDEDEDDVEVAAELDEGPVFIQTSVIQQMQAGDAHPGAGQLTMEDMEPSEKIIQQEKKAKEREQKAMSDGTVDTPVIPSIPGAENTKEGQPLGQGEEKPPLAQDEKKRQKKEKKEVQEPVEEVVEIDHNEEEQVGNFDAVADVGETELPESISEMQHEEEPKVPEGRKGKRVCRCEGCDGKVYGDEGYREDKDGVQYKRGRKSSEEEQHMEVKSAGVVEQPKRYYYRIVVFNGLRSFDGVTDGGLQVCAVISCTDTSVESCGKIHGDHTNLMPTTFEQVTINGRFRRKHALPMPSIVGFDMLPLPASAFSLKVTPQNDDEADVTLTTNQETSFATFGIYSRNFQEDPQKPTNIG